MPRRLLIALLLLTLAGAAALVAGTRGGGDTESRLAAARPCEDESKEREERGEKGEKGRSRTARDGREGSFFSGPSLKEPPCGERPGLPESFADLARANSSIASRSVAPGTRLKPGAYRAAARAAADLPATDGEWKPYGRAPLETGRTEYDVSDGSTTLGLGNVAGRLNVFAHDPASGRLFTTGSAAGVWTSTDGGDSWTSIGDGLPTQSVNGLAWTSAGGGTLIALTGDSAFGGSAYAGMGAYFTTDLGKTWQRASGIPDGTLAAKVVIDPTEASRAYAATGAGLFRSSDAGRTWVNVNLPVGEDAPEGSPDCTGKSPTVKGCYLANIVTDVVVQYPDNEQTDGTPGAVMAAVGWRAGTRLNADGTMQSPGNGLYVSPTGAPGTFENIRIEDNNVPLNGGDPLTKDVLGRIELGVAKGPEQNREFVYAIIQDAVKFQGGAGGLDVSEEAGVPNPTYLNAVWVSSGFGETEWRELEGANTLSNDPTRESALTVACQAPIVAYCPGVQAWYNLWVEPDPTRADANGVPTRLAFGLEEIWADDPAVDNPLDGSTPMHAKVVGRYYGGSACGVLIIFNQLPACPTQPQGVPEQTTHPDQHGAMWLPDGEGGVTLFAANDGGVYKQHRAADEDLSNDDWTEGSNRGMNTLQPYHLAVSRNGTLYMGLQDNGEAKIDPDGRTYTVYGGDGFFSAVEPDNPDVAYEEYTNGRIAKTLDGGKNWEIIEPTNMTDGLFSTPFEMDDNNPKHLVIGGRTVEETTAGGDTTSDSWASVFDLGTREHPGDPDASPSGDDAVNQASAIDTKSFPGPPNLPTGPKSPDDRYTGGGTTAPGGQENPAEPGQFPPGTYEDHAITLAPDAGNQSMTVRISWANKDYDWDLYLYRRNADGDLEEVDASTKSSNNAGGLGDVPTGDEQVVVQNPAPGEYVVRAVNFAAQGTYDGAITFTQRTSPSDTLSATYIGFCGFCDTITQGTPFANGIATNVGGDKQGKAGSSDGWHIAAAKGLPERLITSVRMDPTDPRTVYVTLGGYNRRWVAPGAVSEDTSQVGKGHVFKSTDGGENFVDISGNLPDAPANWTDLRDGQLIVATDVGVFLSCDDGGGAYSRLGRGLPTAPAMALQFRPGSTDELFVATFGRSVYTYKFSGPARRCGADQAPAPPVVVPGQPNPTTPASCTALRGFDKVRVRNAARGALRISVSRKVDVPFTIDVFRESRGRRIVTEKRVGHFPRRSRGLVWRGARRLRNGYYFVRFVMRAQGASDARRIPLRKRGRRFRTRPGFHASRRCNLIRLARLTRPVFGGTNRKPMRVSARLSEPGSVSITVRRGKRVVARKRFAEAGTRVRRFTVSLRRTLRRGDYKATVVARSGNVSERVTLTGRRL